MWKTKFKVGDRVKVREDLKLGKHYKMEHYPEDDDVVKDMLKFAGKTVTINRITFNGTYRIEESGWSWTDEMFEGLADVCDTKVVIYCKGKDVIAKNTKTGETAKATCHPDDPFDFNIGAKLALERLTTPHEEKRKAKIGEYIKITNPTMSFGYYTAGDVIKVTKYFEKSEDSVVGINLRTNSKTCCILHEEYVVLNRYESKEEEPKLYNGKVVCVSSSRINYGATVGKIYEFVDGVGISDNKIKFTTYPIKSLDELHELLPYLKFIEVIE